MNFSLIDELRYLQIIQGDTTHVRGPSHHHFQTSLTPRQPEFSLVCGQMP